MMSNQTLRSSSQSEKYRQKYSIVDFQSFLNNFMQSEFWKAMESTVENSPWHREANVAVHTLMTMDAERQRYAASLGTSDLSDENSPTHIQERREHILTMFALLFHDTGKPQAEQVKESAERGIYRSYAGHEQISARVFEDYAISHWTEIAHILQPQDIYVITWMIEHHLPYTVTKEHKLKALATTLGKIFAPCSVNAFFNMLKGDSYGRDSDNWDENYGNVLLWIEAMQQRIQQVSASNVPSSKLAANTLFMLIGPPGVGKSTIRKHLSVIYENDVCIYSLDDLRYEYADKFGNMNSQSHPDPYELYTAVFRYCSDPDNEKLFSQYAEADLQAKLAMNKNIIIDNTNTSAKSRNDILQKAAPRKMATIAFYFPSSIDLLLARNVLRNDKKLPHSVLQRMHSSVAVPAVGEFDEVHLVFPPHVV